MTSQEFTIWLKGFITACNDYAPTPKQWDTIKEELQKVNSFKSTNTSTAYSYPENATWSYSNGENK